MPEQIKPSVTNPTIAEIYRSIVDGSLILKPDFQRRFVWTHEHQEEFIDTILKGFPFPEIYVCVGDVSVEKMRTTRLVIDGQQRLTTIKKYIDGEHDKPLMKVPPFKELGDRAKDFISYQVVVRDLGNVDDVTIREVFRRINLTKFKLDNVEIHNAIYDGAFIKAAKAIAEAIRLERYGVFSDSEFTRMADLHFILLLMATIERGGYFHEDKEIERCISDFNEEYEAAPFMMKTIQEVFSVIDKAQIPFDSIWFRKSNFFTLVAELANHIGKIPNNIQSKLVDLEGKILKDRQNADTIYGKYYRYMYQGTNQRKARIIRSEVFRYEIFGGPKPEL